MNLKPGEGKTYIENLLKNLRERLPVRGVLGPVRQHDFDTIAISFPRFEIIDPQNKIAICKTAQSSFSNHA